MLIAGLEKGANLYIARPQIRAVSGSENFACYACEKWGDAYLKIVKAIRLSFHHA